MRARGKRTPKDDIIDHIEDEFFFGDGLKDDTVDRLHKMTAAGLFLLQQLFSLVQRKAFEKSARKAANITEERQTIVAFVRKAYRANTVGGSLTQKLADEIERGEHWKDITE